MTEKENLSYNPGSSAIILVGTSKYSPESGYTNIPAVENNIIGLVDVFTDKDIFNIPPENISSSLNSIHPQDIYQIITKKEDEFDLLVFYYAGHGSINYKNHSDLILTLTKVQSKNQDLFSLEYSKLKEAISSVKAKLKIIILDSCFSGLAAEELMTNAIEEILSIEGAIVLTSSGSTQYSLIPKGSVYTGFTGILIKVLSEGLTNENETITIKELYDNISRQAKKTGLPSPKIKATVDTSTVNFCLNKYTHIRQIRRENTDKPKLLLIKTLTNHPIKNYDFGVPLGLYVLKSYLRRYGYLVDILDERLEKLRGTELDIEKIIEGYDIVGISVCSAEVFIALQRFRVARKLNKVTIAGGIFSYSNEKYLLSYPEVDYVIPGVATRLLRLLLENIDIGTKSKVENIKGVYCKTNRDTLNWETRDPIWTPDTIPYIDKTIFDELITVYGPFLNGKIDLVTSRGCSFRCDFCSIQRECSRTPRTRNDLDVVENIEYLASEGFKIISIKDEIFPLEIDRSRKILKEANERLSRNKSPIQYKIKSRLDTIKKNPKLLEEFAKYNVTEIQYGVESLNPLMLNYIHKSASYNVTVIRDFFNLHRDLGITINASFIIGIEGEDENYYNTFMRALNNVFFEGLKVYINFYTPHPFNGLWNINKDSILLINDLNYFTHKIPVLIPSTLNSKTKKNIILDTYEEAVSITQSRIYNPPIPDNAKHQLLNNFKDLKDVSIPIYNL